MISKQNAQELVSKEIGNDAEIIENATIEKSWGWVFFYNSKKFLKSEKIQDMLLGNAPYIVNKKTGEIQVTGTAWPIEKYIEDYETQLLGGV